MASRPPEDRILHVLVMLDPGAPSAEALEAVTSFSAGRPARLLGLFVEDADLHRLAELPFAREIRFAGGTESALEPGRLSQEIERQMVEVRQRFEEASASLRLASSFRVVRGQVLEEVERAAAEADLLLIGRAGRRAGLRNWQARALGLLPGRIRKTVVYVQESWATGRTVVAYWDGDDESRVNVETAHALATAEGAPLLVLTPSAELRGPLEELLERLGSAGRIELVPPLGSDRALGEWTRLLQRVESRVLLLPSDHPEIDDRLLGRLLDRLDCSLVVVAAPGSAPSAA
jgi:hypothetical protein